MRDMLRGIANVTNIKSLYRINIERCSRSAVAFSKNRRGESKTWFSSRSTRSIREKGNWLEQRLLYWPSNVERVSSIFKVLRICWKNCEEALASRSRFQRKKGKEKRETNLPSGNFQTSCNRAARGHENRGWKK